MNKYKEALAQVRDNCFWSQHDKSHEYITLKTFKNLDLLQELVARETPRKPLYEVFVNKYGQQDYRYLCGKCRYLLSYHKDNNVVMVRCKDPECNQVVDWSGIT